MECGNKKVTKVQLGGEFNKLPATKMTNYVGKNVYLQIMAARQKTSFGNNLSALRVMLNEEIGGQEIWPKFKIID